MTATGARAFYLIYRSAGSEKKSFLWIGDAGRMSLADARDRARAADRLRGQGSDPVAERKREERTQRQRPMVAALLSAFVDAGESRKSEKTQDEYRRIVTAEVEGTPVGGTTANDVTAPKLDRPAEERRLPTEERTLNDDEVRRLWLGVEALGRETATFIRLPLLCGTRRGETALAEWDEFALRENGISVWRIRAEHRKGQRGKKRGLVIPLPPIAVRLLGALREETGRGARVFPVVGERFLANLFRSTEDVRQATGVDFTLHDLRATCATGVRRMSGLPHVPALVLGHQGVPGVPDVTSRYDRADTVPEVAKGLNAWAAYIESLVTQEPPLRVVSIQSIRKRTRRG